MTDDRTPTAPAAELEDEDPAWIADLEEDLRRAHSHPQPERGGRPSLIARLLGRA